MYEKLTSIREAKKKFEFIFTLKQIERKQNLIKLNCLKYMRSLFLLLLLIILLASNFLYCISIEIHTQF